MKMIRFKDIVNDLDLQGHDADNLMYAILDHTNLVSPCSEVVFDKDFCFPDNSDTWKEISVALSMMISFDYVDKQKITKGDVA